MNNRNSEDENQQKNGQSTQEDNQIHNQLERFFSKEGANFHFNEEESDIILEEGLILCTYLIEKYDSNADCKKSRTIKRCLTKSLLSLNNFLVQIVVGRHNLDICSVLNKANLILLQGKKISA